MNARGDVILNATVREGEEPRAYTLALTLGAMAEIEQMFGVKSVQEAFARLKPEDGHASMTDLAKVLTGLIRGGGHEITFEEVCRERFELPDVMAAFDALFKGAGEFAPKEDGKKPVARPPQRTGRAGS